MDKNSNSYVIRFALIVCVVSSLALAMTYNVLKPRQVANAEFDRQRNVLKAAGLFDPAGAPVLRAELENLYATRIQTLVVEGKGGEPATRPEQVVVTEMPLEEYSKIRNALELRRIRLLYIASDEAGQPLAYVLPISGRGLWGTLYGYLALEPDANTVKGITFYQHKETPGLGGEVDNPNWTAQWEGKQILDPNAPSPTFVSVTVKKGTVNPEIPRERMHAVDGLSGATITANGVTNAVRSNLLWYEPYLKAIWSKRN